MTEFMAWRRAQQAVALQAWADNSDDITSAVQVLGPGCQIHTVEAASGDRLVLSLLSKGTWAQPVRVEVRRGGEPVVSMVLKPRTDSPHAGKDISRALYECEGRSGMLLNGLQHPGFVHTLHVTDAFIIMEDVEGMSLHSLIAGARDIRHVLGERRVLAFYLGAVACTLNYAQTHTAGAAGAMAFTHNDLSTNNVRMWCLPPGVTLTGTRLPASPEHTAVLTDGMFTTTHPDTGRAAVFFPVIIDFAEASMMTPAGTMHHKTACCAISSAPNSRAVAMGMTPEYVPMGDIALLCTHVLDVVASRFFTLMRRPEHRTAMQECLVCLIDGTGMPPRRLAWCVTPFSYTAPARLPTVRAVRRFVCDLMEVATQAWVPFAYRPVLPELNVAMAPFITAHETNPDQRRFFHTLCPKPERMLTHASTGPWSWMMHHSTEGAWMRPVMMAFFEGKLRPAATDADVFTPREKPRLRGPAGTTAVEPSAKRSRGTP